MKKTPTKKVIFAASVVLALGFGLGGLTSPVKAATPELSIVTNGSNLELSVSGADPYSEVNVYQEQSSSTWSTITDLGETDANGNFNQIGALVFDGSNNPLQAYVVIDGQQSNTAEITPTGNTSTGSGNIYLNSSVLDVTAGQTGTLTASGNSGALYISSNSNSSVLSAGISGQTISIYGISAGSSVLTICQNNYSGCVSATVTVSGSSSGGSGLITFSNSAPTLSVGQSQDIYISSANSYNGSYYWSGNSNPSVAAVNLSGTALVITALNAGSTAITVCEVNNNSYCGNLTITVGGSAVASSLTFSVATPSVQIGQSSTVGISSNNSYSGAYTISSNSNPAAVSAAVSGSSLVIIANATGSSTLQVCETGSSVCGALTVNGSNSSGAVSFTTTSLPAMTVGDLYNEQLQATGGTGSYTYSLSSGSLPAGLTLSSSGLISGTPTSADTGSFTVVVADSAGNQANQSLTIPAATTVINGTYTNGELINEGGTVSIVYNNQKTGFATADAFTGLGFDFANVVNVSNSGLPSTGQVVTTADAAHPWGSWILSGNTVYFVSQSGLIPVADWSTFLNNSGTAAKLVPANSYDMALTQLSIMTDNDSRLQ